ncbi:hypothetical protein CTAM01_16648 [Colletotrichum tamarilloi]|uniref:Uncharacterized protein n=1 Tax=Colletotrichum tamarilloi TaxID=1209934 RepID=A0ABQ9QHV3_9PEZI|nr:uncharacterized protein CTAM01_16648 [Colletotrichum tamarilloi]KAK1471150.1 hypothetical protein CTAM01_16648 [Colletotrichum tamarilloi]
MADFERVFRYNPQATTVVNLLTKDCGPVVWSHKTAEDWESWLQDVSVNVKELESTNYPAIIYQCRSSNTWADDMALTATYFPHSHLTFAILFGCTADVEKNVFNRLSRAKDRVCHPMILPGIFAEIERDRMIKVVEKTVDDIEGAIFDLGTGNPIEGDTLQEENRINTRRSRRTAWLNTTYLRNSLRMWQVQLRKMVDHVAQPLGFDHNPPYNENEKSGDNEPRDQKNGCMKTTGTMISDRLNVLIEEFEDRIQDCTMSVEGMTIATQWAQGDTNVDIATATGRDSRQMRSIALVTMIFLPGTFFATLFSMTFFDWSTNDDKKSVVSGYIWIYFLVTGVFTACTLVIWWYFLSPHRKKYRSCNFAQPILSNQA